MAQARFEAGFKPRVFKTTVLKRFSKFIMSDDRNIGSHPIQHVGRSEHRITSDRNCRTCRTHAHDAADCNSKKHNCARCKYNAKDFWFFKKIIGCIPIGIPTWGLGIPTWGLGIPTFPIGKIRMFQNANFGFRKIRNCQNNDFGICR